MKGIVLLVIGAFSFPAVAETPGEIPKPWTYEGSKKLQEQQQQPQAAPPSYQGQGQAPRVNPGTAPGAAAAEAARRQWLGRPPLPADKNPLLGRWTRPASAQAKANDPFAQLGALAKGGMCEVLFGGGTFEFRPDSLVGMDARTPPQVLDQVEYRGNEKHVVVLPKTTIKLIEFDFDGPNRINWTGQNCALVRVGGAGESQKIASAAPSSSSVAPQGTGGALALSVAALSPQDRVAGRKFWVLKADPNFVLIKAGLTQTPYGTVLQNWMRACEKKEQACGTGMQALQPYSVGFVAADDQGHARTPPLPTGRYWVLSDARIADRHMMWFQPVDVKGPDAQLTFDARNAMSVN